MDMYIYDIISETFVEFYYRHLNTSSVIILLVSHVDPIHPDTQVQIYLSIPSRQIPPFLHGLGLHSSISRSKIMRTIWTYLNGCHWSKYKVWIILKMQGYMRFIYKCMFQSTKYQIELKKYVLLTSSIVLNNVIIIPNRTHFNDLLISQLIPVHPGSQMQVYRLISSWHWPLTQGALEHSSISINNSKEKLKILKNWHWNKHIFVIWR